MFAYVNHDRLRSWYQQVLSKDGKVSCSRKQRGALLASTDYESDALPTAPILVKMLWYTLYIYHCIDFIKSQQLKLATCFDPRHCNKIDSANAVWMTMGDLHIHGSNCKIFWNLIIKLLSIWGVDLSLLPSVHCPYNYFRNVKYCVFGFPWI